MAGVKQMPPPKPEAACPQCGTVRSGFAASSGTASATETRSANSSATCAITGSFSRVRGNSPSGTTTLRQRPSGAHSRIFRNHALDAIWVERPVEEIADEDDQARAACKNSSHLDPRLNR